MNSSIRRTLVCLLFYVLVCVASFYPQSFHPSDTIGYIGDSLESVYLAGWHAHQFFDDPRHLFDANHSYPSDNALAFTDHRFLQSMLVSPVTLATGNPVLGYNVALLLASLLAAFGARRLALALGANELAAWAAGALYAFHTYQINEAPRLHIFTHGFLPFALYELLAFLDTGLPRKAFVFGGWVLLQGWSSNYHLMYTSVVLGLVLVVYAAWKPGTVARRLPRLAVAAVVCGLLYVPLGLPYVLAAAAHGYSRPLTRGIDLAHYFSTPAGNLLYGPMGVEVRPITGASHFVGFAPTILAAVALAAWATRRGSEPKSSLVPTRVWVPAAAILFLVLLFLSMGDEIRAFGYSVGPGPYRALYDWVPGFRQMRMPERFSLHAMLFLSLLAARGLTLLRSRLGGGLSLLLALLVPLEHLTPLSTTDRMPVGGEVPSVYRWLADDDARAVAEVPVRGEGLVRKETLEMYFSLFHKKNIVQGFSGFPPLLTNTLRWLLLDFPSERSLQSLKRIGVDTVIVHRGQPGEDENLSFLPEAVRKGWLLPVIRFSGAEAHVYEGTADEVYRLGNLPEVARAPFPEGLIQQDDKWSYRTKGGDPELAVDGDLSTAWEVPRPLIGDEYFEVDFGEPVSVSGVVFRLRRDSFFPSQFRIVGRTPDGERVRLARFEASQAVQLIDNLRESSDDVAWGFDLGDRELTQLSIFVGEGGTRWDLLDLPAWSLPEIEILRSEERSGLAPSLRDRAEPDQNFRSLESR